MEIDAEQKTKVIVNSKAKIYAGISVFLFFAGALFSGNMEMPNLICISWLAWLGAFLCGIMSVWNMRNIKEVSGTRLLVLIYCIFIICIAFGVPCINSDALIMNKVHCRANLDVLSRSIITYSEKHDGEFPDPSKWCNLIISEPNNKFDNKNDNPNNLSIFSEKSFRCLMVTEGRSGYAFNKNLAGRRISEVNPNTVVLFETTATGWNQNGGFEIMCPDRHKRIFGEGGSYVVCLGKEKPVIKFVPQSEAKNLRWEP
jgi:hypothetical protein